LVPPGIDFSGSYLDIKRFENQKGTPQVLLDILNGVPIKVPDGL
jgi:hypothetical protein